MFLNDLEEFLLTKDIVGLKSITDELETELEIYLKIFVMLYEAFSKSINAQYNFFFFDFKI
jgi:hypothetical protein